MFLRRFPIRSIALLLGGLLLITLAAGCAKIQAAPEEPPPAPVKAGVGRALLIAGWTELVGSTQPLPDHVARISAAVEGRVVAVPGHGAAKGVCEGQEVKAGDVIVQLDDQVIQANRAKAEAALRDLDEQLKQAEIAEKLAKLTIDSKEALRKRMVQLGASQDLGASELELSQARLALEDAQSKQRGLVAKVACGKADLKMLEEQLRFYTLRAPISGRLGMVQVVPGQVLSVGTPVAEIVDLSEIDVVSFVPPYVAGQLAQNQPARVVKEEEGQDDSSAPQGKVVFIALQAQADTGNFPVKVRLPNPDLRLRANTVVRVQVQTQPEKERLTIPETALMEDQDPPAVIIVEHLEVKKNADGKDEKRGKARKLVAKVGLRDRRWHVVEILGLEDPEKKQTVPLQDVLFVIEGNHGLQDGDDVKLDEEEEEEK
jgi:RND family efflux transporter MFP subunit